MSLWRHASLWDAPPNTAHLSLGEGDTPLVRSVRIGPRLGIENLWFKLEGANPTGSYKDRFAAAAVAHLHAEKRRACFGTSSGNAGAALAAYCARVGLPCVLAIVEGAPEGKLRQMLAYGARLVPIREFGKSPRVTADVMGGLRELAAEMNAALEISAFAFSARSMAGVQSISAELAETLGATAISVFVPAGGGGLALAVARGFEVCSLRQGWSGRARVHCVQPAGNDTIASPLRASETQARAVSSTTTLSGLQVGSVIDGRETLAACRRSGGQGYVIKDENALGWQARLAAEEGVFCEPAGAVALAGVEEALRCGEIDPRDHVVCLVTGSGFKDERSLLRLADPAAAELADDFADFASRVRREL